VTRVRDAVLGTPLFTSFECSLNTSFHIHPPPTHLYKTKSDRKLKDVVESKRVNHSVLSLYSFLFLYFVSFNPSFFVSFRLTFLVRFLIFPFSFVTSFAFFCPFPFSGVGHALAYAKNILWARPCVGLSRLS
jgi:hypothetical protein